MMRSTVRFVVATAFVVMTMTGPGVTANADQQETAVTCLSEQVLVKVLPGADPAEVVARHGGTILKTITGIDVQVVEVPAGTLAQKVDEFSADPDVKYAEPNGIVRAAQSADGQPCQPPTAGTNP